MEDIPGGPRALEPDRCVAAIFCGKYIWSAVSYVAITGVASKALTNFLPITSVLISCDIALRLREKKKAEALAPAKKRPGPERGRGQRIRPPMPGGPGDVRPAFGGSVARSNPS